MREASLKRMQERSSATERITRSSARRSGLIVAVLLGVALLTVAVRAYNHATLSRVSSAKPSAPARLARADILPQTGMLFTRLALQPEADKLRRRLGQRFLAPGREITLMTASLKIGTEFHVASIVRAQQDTGESLTITLDGGPTLLTWSASQGAQSAGIPATGAVRGLIERIALDSPDQFILAQLRGVSYYTAARSAMPVEANGADDYAGPVWDLVRIGEPSADASNKPLSLSRLYYINSSTGLIDKIASQEQGDTVIAEVSNWINQSGEVEPTSIVWRTNNQVLMQLTVTNIANVAR